MDADCVRDLASAALLAPSADNSQPWTLRWDGNELSIAFRRCHQRHSVFSANSHATLLSVGAVIEHVETALAANGIPANWRWSPELAQGTPYAAIPLLHKKSAAFIKPEGLMRRYTNRFAFRRDPLPSSIIREVESSIEAKIRIAPVYAGQLRSKLIRLVQLSSEARFCTQELHEWLIESLRFTPEEVAQGDGLDIRTISLPPGGKQFMRFISSWRRMKMLNVMGAYKLMALSEISLLPASPALFGIIGPADARSAVDAGRLMTRLWIHLNLNGIAVHPHYAVTDQINRLHEGKTPSGFESKIGEVEEQARELLGMQPSEILHIILRAGYPKKQPPRSRRLPLDAIFIDNSRP